MRKPQPSHLSVEVDRTADPISGRVHGSDGPQLPFVGWLGLISALERVIVLNRAAQPTTSVIPPVMQARSPTNEQEKSSELSSSLPRKGPR
jgi:hypothetical protein